MKRGTRFITEIAISVALAVILHFITIWRMPQGGNISLEMLPIIIVGIRLGGVAGIISGSLYGLINLFIDGIAIHPLSILLDYILAFALVGVAGFFKGSDLRIVLGSVIAMLGRFICSFLSGFIVFAEYAPEGQNPVLYSLIYQASYLVPQMIITVLILVIVLKKGRRIVS